MFVVRGDTGQAGPVLALAAGLQWGASDVSIKALSARLPDLGGLVLLHPLALVILSLSLVGLVVSARSLQLGPSVAVIAITSAAGNVVTIAAGPIVFGEPLPDSTLSLVAADRRVQPRVRGRGADAGADGGSDPAGRERPGGHVARVVGEDPARPRPRSGASVGRRSPRISRTRTVAAICRSAAFGVVAAERPVVEPAADALDLRRQPGEVLGEPHAGDLVVLPGRAA